MRTNSYLAIISLIMGTYVMGMAITSQANTLNETPEINFSHPEAIALHEKAMQLGSAVGIYEYVHNTIDFSPYHGSRSGSINTFLGQRGSDVDIATTMLAMLRSQNIPARYAVGTVRIPTAQLTNWLGIPQLDTAIEVLKDQGIQKIVLSSNRSNVDFEHVWAEAFVPFDQYRGINMASPAIDCSQAENASRCTWVALDASFKQKKYKGLNLDPYNAVSFEYTAYYNAIKNNDETRRDKNPISILEAQIGAWLRSNHPGKTIEDVEDAGEIIAIRDGLLPASLPYKVIGSIRNYNSVAEHDLAVPNTEPKKWGKTLRVVFDWDYTAANGGRIVLQGLSTQPMLLTDIVNKRLTLALETQAEMGSRIALRLGGDEIPNPIAGFLSVGQEPPIGTPFYMTLVMDGAPSNEVGVQDRNISALYSGIVGGYYLIATGGESSNWSQVHRAANQLLAANMQYKIVFNPGEEACLADGTNCTPYVDANGNGWDASDVKLLESKAALDALTGGLLQVSATQYYAKAREQIERSDRLMKTKTPILGFLGVVSSVYEAEYIDGTAFSILPGGLLIDMKGLTIGGSYRANESTLTYSNRQFEFLAHALSSLEHEIWQELTGYDAVSTVRGIQMALANGASMLSLKKNLTQNTLPENYAALGFTSMPPAGFSLVPFTIFSTAPDTWAHAVSGSSFDTFLGTVDSNVTSLRRAYANYSYSPNGGLYGWSKCVSDRITAINNYPNGLWSGSTCLGTTYTYYTKAQIISLYNSEWFNTIVPYVLNQNYVNYFDRNQGFVRSNQVYRAYPSALDAHSTDFVVGIRNDLSLRDLSQSWVEYMLPSKLTAGATYRFSVDIRKQYETAGNNLSSVSMDIANKSFSAGGGYIEFNALDIGSLEKEGN